LMLMSENDSYRDIARDISLVIFYSKFIKYNQFFPYLVRVPPLDYKRIKTYFSRYLDCCIFFNNKLPGLLPSMNMAETAGCGFGGAMRLDYMRYRQTDTV